MVGELVKPMHAHLQIQPAPRSLADSLLAFAGAHQRYMLTAGHIALGQMLISEAPRFPLVARQLYWIVLGERQHSLAQRMSQSMDRQEIRRDDPEVAAEMFLAMLEGLEGDRRLLGLRGRGSKAQDAWAQHAVALFFKAYALPAGAGDASSTSDLARTEPT